MKLPERSEIVVKSPGVNFHENPSGRRLVVPYRQTDRRDAANTRYVNAPNIEMRRIRRKVAVAKLKFFPALARRG